MTLGSVVVAQVLFLVARQHAVPEQKIENLSFTIRSAYPEISLAPTTVTFSYRVRDPKQELHCPSFFWEWGDGCRSAVISYCDPYAMPQDEPLAYGDFVAHRYFFPGDYEVRLTLRDFGHTIVATKQIHVISRLGQ